MPSPFSNFFVKTLLNSPLHPLMGRNIALITVIGRKTGRTISTPINTITLEDALTVISMRNRTWWRNLREGRTGFLRQSGKTFPVHAEVVETPEKVITWLEKYFAQYPGYAKYFGIDLGPDGKPISQRLERLAAERVIIRLFPGGKG
jgi:deazaflavin-dependent oxidoreductase (nitroreductase family)